MISSLEDTNDNRSSDFNFLIVKLTKNEKNYLALAYASLANVNAVVGLYTSLFPTLVYVVFGTSKHVNLGTLIL